MTAQHADVLVVGGGVGGVAATVAALGLGCSVVLVEESPWLGGQLTSQAVPPDEHPWIERLGGSATYRRFRSALRSYYRAWYPLTAEARHKRHLNPGDGWVGPLCHEPQVSRAVIEAMLQPHRAAGRLAVLTDTVPYEVDTAGDSLRAISFLDRRDGRPITVDAEIVIDATEMGDILEISGTELVTGSESRDRTGEPHAPLKPQPLNMQAFTVCLAVDHAGDPDSVIERPRRYDDWRTRRAPYGPGLQLAWIAANPRTLEPVHYDFDPNPSRDAAPDLSHIRGHVPATKDLWSYRRILARRNLRTGALPSDLSILNWPQNDYVGGPLYGVPPSTAAAHLEEARQLSLSLLYWLQTQAPRPDGGIGWPRLRARGDVVGSGDGLALRPYVRESRRLVAECTVTEQDVSVAVRGHRGAVRYDDSVGTGYYRLDLHPTTGGDNFLDIPSHPYEVPLGALLPVRVENLLAGSKNIGTTHITNGCYRVHPTEWVVGEAAGTMAGFCLAHRVRPRQVRHNPSLLSEYRGLLAANGMDLHWPPGWVAP